MPEIKTTSNRIKPLVVQELFCDQVKILAYGRAAGVIDNQQAAAIGRRFEVKQIYHPNTAGFNAKIDQNPLETLGWQIERYHNIVVRDKLEVEGLIIPPGCLAWFRTADCLVIIARHCGTGEMVAAHAGRDSLIDSACYGYSRLGRDRRRHFSVVDAMIETLTRNGERPEDIEVFCGFGISQLSFSHSVEDERWGERNQRLIDFLENRYGKDIDSILLKPRNLGWLNLRRLVEIQCNKLGVEEIIFDGVDTASDRRWFSRRGPEGEGDPPGHLNSIFVLNRE